MTRILDGKKVAERLRESLKQRITRLKKKPGLAIVQVGENPESTLYVRIKERASADLGIHFEKHLLPESASQDEVMRIIRELNGRAEIQGIVIQLPLPRHLDTPLLLSTVALEKDVDGLHPKFQEAIQHNRRTAWLPALQQSIMTLLEESGTSLKGKTALILAKSEEFRTTLSSILQKHGCRVTPAENIGAAGDLGNADIVISALSEPRCLHDEKLRQGTIVIDVGLSKLPDGTIVGNYAGPGESPHAAAYSPVPGGIGPVTVASLLENTITAAERAQKKSPLSIQISVASLFVIVASLMFGVSPFFFGGQDYRGRLILAVGSALLGLISLFFRPRLSSQRWYRQPETFLFGFLLFAALATIFSPSMRKSLEDFMMLATGALLFFIGRMSTNERVRERFFQALVAAGTALAGWSLVYYIQHDSSDFRIAGPLKNEDGLGAALVLPAALALGYALTTRRRATKIVCAAAFLIILLTLILTAALPTFVGVIVGCLFGYLMFRPHMTWKFPVFALVTIALLYGIGTGIRTTHTHHGASGERQVLTGFPIGGASGSLQQRLSFFRSTLMMTRDYPLLGVGLNMWSDYFPKYEKSLVERTELAHSSLAHYISETGVIGGAAFIGFLAVIGWGFARLRKDKTVRSTIVPYAVIGVAALTFSGLFDIAWFYPSLLLLTWFVAGLLQNETREVRGKIQKRLSSIGIGFAAIIILSSGFLRFITTYYVSAAEHAAVTSDFIDSIATAELAMRLFPTPTEELQMTIVLVSKGWSPLDRKEMETWAERTLKHNPLQPASYLLLGRIVQSTGNTARAEQLFRDGLKRDPHFVPDLAVDLTSLLVRQRRYTEARDVASAQISRTGYNVPQREKSLAALEYNKAQAELALDERDAAHASLISAHKLQPADADVIHLLVQEFNDPQ